MSHTQTNVNSANGGSFKSNPVSDTGTGSVRQSDKQAYRSRSKDPTIESMRTNDKDGKIGLMKSLRPN